MTTTVRVSVGGTVALPESFRRRRKIEAGMGLRVTDLGESILLTPVYPPSEEELAAVIADAGGPGPVETPKARKQVEAAIARVRARARKAQGSH